MSPIEGISWVLLNLLVLSESFLIFYTIEYNRNRGYLLHRLAAFEKVVILVDSKTDIPAVFFLQNSANIKDKWHTTGPQMFPGFSRK
jgi:hypothetical protein